TAPRARLRAARDVASVDLREARSEPAWDSGGALPTPHGNEGEWVGRLYRLAPSPSAARPRAGRGQPRRDLVPRARRQDRQRARRRALGGGRPVQHHEAGGLSPRALEVALAPAGGETLRSGVDPVLRSGRRGAAREPEPGRQIEEEREIRSKPAGRGAIPR